MHSIQNPHPFLLEGSPPRREISAAMVAIPLKVDRNLVEIARNRLLVMMVGKKHGVRCQHEPKD
jgi:hypothetical protein